MRAILLILLLAGISPALAQVDPTTAHQINRLKNGTPAQRIGVAEEVYGAGIEEPAIYQAIAESLAAGLETAAKGDERLDEYAWYLKALASSGDLAYMPLLDRAIATGLRPLVRHGRDAKETLQEAARTGRAYLMEEKVRIITDAQAQHCVFVRQQTCEAHGPPEECLGEHRALALEAGADSVQVLTMSGSAPLGFSSGPLGLFASAAVTANYFDCRKPALPSAPAQ